MPRRKVTKPHPHTETEQKNKQKTEQNKTTHIKPKITQIALKTPHKHVRTHTLAQIYTHGTHKAQQHKIKLITK